MDAKSFNEVADENDDNDDGDDDTLFLVAFARFVADGAEDTSEELSSSGTPSSSRSLSRSRFSVTVTVDIFVATLLCAQYFSVEKFLGNIF